MPTAEVSVPAMNKSFLFFFFFSNDFTKQINISFVQSIHEKTTHEVINALG